MWIMAALWLILIGILFFLIKKHRIILNKEKIKLNKKFQKEEERLIKDYEELEAKLAARAKGIQDNYAEKEKWLKWDLDKLKNDKETLDRHICELKDFGQRQVDEKIKDYEQLRLTQINHSLELEEKRKQELLQRQLDDFIASAAETKKSVNDEIEELKLLLEDYKSKRDLINQAIVHEKEIHEQQDFYRIVLNESDKEDIQLLNTIGMRLHSREALYKLIYDVFYKKPLNDMINRVLQGKEFCGIYRITNLKTNEAYIGKSTNIKTRWQNHCKTAIGLDGMARTKIHSAMKEYGIDNFSFEVLEKCTKENYSEREKYWINFYETNVYGYNIQK
jgi:hypothetical protein